MEVLMNGSSDIANILDSILKISVSLPEEDDYLLAERIEQVNYNMFRLAVNNEKYSLADLNALYTLQEFPVYLHFMILVDSLKKQGIDISTVIDEENDLSILYSIYEDTFDPLKWSFTEDISMNNLLFYAMKKFDYLQSFDFTYPNVPAEIANLSTIFKSGRRAIAMTAADNIFRNLCY